MNNQTRRRAALGLLAAAVAVPSAGAAQRGRDLRVQVDADAQDTFRPGQRVRLAVQSSDAAYVAVLHIAPDGRLEFLYPRSPLDNGWTWGGRSRELPEARWGVWQVGSTTGIGYVYAIASAEPLDFRLFRSRYGGDWDFARVGPLVHGDPFFALQGLTRLLVPDFQGDRYATDGFTYYVGRRHARPSYACYDGALRHSGTVLFNSPYVTCDRLELLLRAHPDYYDYRRYRGDREVYWRELERGRPAHTPKEHSGWRSPGRAVTPRETEARGVPWRRSGADRSSEERPTLERRPRVRPEPAPRSAPRTETRPEARPGGRRPEPAPRPREQVRPPVPRREPARPASERPAIEPPTP